MLRKLRPRSIYDVCAALALFVALGGTAYAVNTIGSTDIIDGQVKSVDIGNGEVNSADVKDNSINTFDVHSFLGADVVDETLTGDDIGNGSLNDEDVGQGAMVNFELNFGTIQPGACTITGVFAGAQAGDHMLLTPARDADTRLDYRVYYDPTIDTANIAACNRADVVVNTVTEHFSLLVFDAQ